MPHTRRVGRGIGRPRALAFAAAIAAGACSSGGPDQEPAALVTARAVAASAKGGTLASLLAPNGASWQRTGEQLTSSGWRAASAQRFDLLGARLPVTADGVLDVGVSRVERLQLHLRMEGATPTAAEVDQGRVVYEGAWPSSDAIVVASDTTLDELVLLHDAGAPRELAWSVDLPGAILGTRDDGGGGLLWLDAAGQAQLHTPRPFVLDATGVQIDAELRFSAGRLVVTYDPTGVTFPALLDPAIESTFWEYLQPATSPPARVSAAMVFDTTRGVSVLFGGAGSSADLGDTWEWDGTTWTQQCMSAACSAAGKLPTARPGAAMAFDTTQAVTVLFGGGDSGMEQNDTWSWNGQVWTALCPVASCTPPNPRTQASMVFYAGSGTAVLFGGSETGPCGASPVSDTWIWNGSTWQSAAPAASPPARSGAGMTFDAAHDVALLFGGNGNATDLGDTWTWDGTKTTWTQLCMQAPCTNLGARAQPAMTYDAVTTKTVLFGGHTGSGQVGDTWQWDGTTWTPMSGTAGPSARGQAAMAYDAKRARVVMFGGSVGGTPVAETWEYHTHGAACTADTQCDTGHCIDGVCCETVCGTCQRCDQAASLEPGPPPPGPVASPGICSPVTDAQDPDTCTGGMTCDAEGQCKAGPGRICSVGADCASGSCIDGCCDGISPCSPADAGVGAASPEGGAPAESPGTSKGGGCGCKAGGEYDGRAAGAAGALLVVLVVASRRRGRRSARVATRATMTTTMALGGVAASCSLVTPLDSLDSQQSPDAGGGADATPQDARIDATQDAPVPLSDGGVQDTGSGTPPGHPATWSVRFGDEQDQEVYAVAADAAGHLFVAGAFAGYIDFGPGNTLASTGGDDAFVAMLDSQGNGVWAKSLGGVVTDAGTSDQRAFGVAVDAAGDVFVCGAFAGSLVAGSSTFASAGGTDAFVTKLSPTGTFQWTVPMGGPGDQAALGIAADPSGNVVVGGSFEDTVTLSSTTLVSQGGFDAFTARFNSNGSPYWIVPFGGTADEIGTAVAIADGGALYATGYFAGAGNVGTVAEAGVLVSAGGFDVARYALAANTGATLGAGQFGDPSNQYGYAIAIDGIGNGHMALAGPFQGSLTVGTEPPLQSAGLDDVFVAKFDLSTGPEWSARFGDAQEQIAYGTAIDPAGNVLVAGALQGTATLGTSTVVGAGGNDAVLAKLDPEGTPLWLERFGDANDQVGTAVTTTLVNGMYDVVLVGNFAGQIDLGNGPLVSQGGNDFFIAVFAP